MDAIEVLTDEAAVDAIAPEWDDLVDRSPAPSVFLTPLFLRTWWQAYAGDLAMHLVVVRRGGRMVAVAPLAIDSARPRRVVGWANDYTDRFGFVVDAGALDAVDSIAQHLAALGGWAVLWLRPLEESSPVTVSLRDALRRAGIGAGTVATLQSPWIDLPDTWDEMAGRLGASFRSTIRRRERAADKAGLTVAISGDPEVVDDAFVVARTGWAHHEGTSIASTEANRAFVTALARSASERGWLRIATMSDGSRPVAFELNLIRNGDAVNLKVGYDPEYSSLSPGLVLRAAAVRGLIGEGTRTFDLLGEAEPYKLHWTDRVRSHVRLRGYPPSLRGRAEHWMRHVVRPAVRRLRGGKGGDG